MPGPSHRSRATSCPGRKSDSVDPEEVEEDQDEAVRRRSLRQKVQDVVGLCLRPPTVRGPALVWSKRRVHSELRDATLKSDLNHWDLDQNLNQVQRKNQLRDMDQINGNCPVSWTDPCSPPLGAPSLREHPSSTNLANASSSSSSDLVPVSDSDCVLVPDLLQISNSPCYWGVMDRLEAETLLEGAPEGTFLLRDSAHREVLFSVSFRRYARSLHARIEQSGRVFSFDGRDPGMYRDPCVGGLLKHYSDPHTCLFFEPLLAHPLPRTFPFSLQHLTRCVICSCTTFSGLQSLPLPPHLKDYLTHYHLKT